MFIKFDDAFASFQLWLRANPNAAVELPSKSFADALDGRAFVQKYSKEWTNEMLFAYLLVAGCAEASDLQRNTTETKKTYKRFVGETAEDTRKLAEAGLSSEK